MLVLLLLSVLNGIYVHGQTGKADSMINRLEATPADTNKVLLLLDIAQHYYFSKPDSCLKYALQGMELSRQLSYEYGELEALKISGEAFRFLGDYPHSLELQFRALQMHQKKKNFYGTAIDMGFIGFTYLEMGEYWQALPYLWKAKPILEENKDTILSCFVSSHIGHCYTMLDMPDSANFYNQHALALVKSLPQGALSTLVYDRMGAMYEKSGQFSDAHLWLQKALSVAQITGIKVNISRSQKMIASLYFNEGQLDSSIYYARQAYANSMYDLQKPHVLDASILLYQLFQKKGNIDSAFHYQGIAMAMKDSIYGAAQFRKLQLLMLAEQEHQQAIVREQASFRTKMKIAGLLSVLGFLVLLAFMQRRNNQRKQKINQELEVKKDKLEKALSELKSAQEQLIQSEKMASLGELTAGIAHEIQNPLNFVNNFAEINNDLLEDLKDSADQQDQREIQRLLSQLKENESKILQHGKRADSIVKSMLQHSRAGSGTKEMTDINKMVDEYVRLSFHGMRARDKSFNTELDILLDPSVGKVPLLSQDFGRVLLNLLNNAFYAVNEKRKNSGELFKPKVSIQTQVAGPWNEHINSIQIRITDNGNGIPSSIKDKVFQPFFTTKPTGEGTGLGLSLSYDIITKSHGGKLTLKTKEGEGAEFIIQIPAD